MRDNIGDEVPVGPLTAPSTGRSAEDKFLLAIIDAYPDWDDSGLGREERREQRLSDAKKALFNERPNDGPKPSDDRRALLYMAQQHYKDLAIQGMREVNPRAYPNWPSKKPRSVRRLAEEAAKLTVANSTDAATERLRKAWKRDGHFWMELVKTHDDVIEAVEHNLLMEIGERLEKLGVHLHIEVPRRA
ncbi:hypothetical protein ACETIH_28505 [Microvirga arabica]|uniref:Uncharacterized protein n=1 Tax=Microvirga arabica TaxID=1128671 RepID=A0ABV6YH39_9HYPH